METYSIVIVFFPFPFSFEPHETSYVTFPSTHRRMMFMNAVLLFLLIMSLLSFGIMQEKKGGDTEDEHEQSSRGPDQKQQLHV